jgi:hypothetical protein
MTQTPASNAKSAIHHHPDAAPPPIPPADPEAPSRKQPREDGLLVDVNALLPRVTRPRRCVLCGGPLRTGQHMLRVHGTTVHARCRQGH